MKIVFLTLAVIAICLVHDLESPEPIEVVTTPVDTISKGDTCKMLGVTVYVERVRPYTNTVDVSMITTDLLNVKRSILKNCTPQP